MSDQRVVLITGASSGVGQSAARLLAQRGYKVFGTSRNPAGAAGILEVEMLSLDVRADDSVRACVEAVNSRGGRIDVLINNAGYELAGALEELSMEGARTQFETSFFGVVRTGQRSSPKHCSRSWPPTVRTCATSLGARRRPSPACGDSFLQECSNKEFGAGSHSTRSNEVSKPISWLPALAGRMWLSPTSA